MPSKTPSSTLKTISHGAPPELTNMFFVNYTRLHDYCGYKFIPARITTGVINVKIAVDKIPRLRVYFPPYLVDRIPPGT